MNISHPRNAARPQRSPSSAPPGSFDWWLVAAVGLLLCLGLVMVFSASFDKYYFFKRQCLFTVLGCPLLVVCANLPRKIIYKLQYPFLFFVIIMLLLTLTPLGVNVKGASRWISLGAFRIQPLEFAKIALALYLAYFMSSKREILKTFSHGMLPPFLVTIGMAWLLLLQPDFGGMVLLVTILFMMCWIGGTRLTYLFIALVMVLFSLVSLAIYSPYRVRRLLAFLDPFDDPQNTGYQLVQSLYALGSGGFFGVGLGESAQKVRYLPEAHNDFIMSVLGEELGFVGISLVMTLFSVVFVRCARIVMGQNDLQDRYSAFGLTMVIALSALFNIAVVVGMAPPKGVAMPFLSYGGSNLIASLICVGLLLNFSRTTRNV